MASSSSSNINASEQRIPQVINNNKGENEEINKNCTILQPRKKKKLEKSLECPSEKIKTNSPDVIENFKCPQTTEVQLSISHIGEFENIIEKFKDESPLSLNKNTQLSEITSCSADPVEAENVVVKIEPSDICLNESDDTENSPLEAHSNPVSPLPVVDSPICGYIYIPGKAPLPCRLLNDNTTTPKPSETASTISTQGTMPILTQGPNGPILIQNPIITQGPTGPILTQGPTASMPILTQGPNGPILLPPPNQIDGILSHTPTTKKTEGSIQTKVLEESNNDIGVDESAKSEENDSTPVLGRTKTKGEKELISLRKQMVQMWEKGMEVKDIAEILNTKTKTVWKWIDRSQETGDLSTKPKTGTRRKTTPEEDNAIIEAYLENPNLTAKQIIKLKGLKVCENLIMSRLRERGCITHNKN